MQTPPDTYGDNFPVAEGLGWNPRTPWRHAHVTPTVPPPWVCRLGWWTLVVLLMGGLLMLAAHDGFSEEPAPAELVVWFQEGALHYPEGTPRLLVPRVEFESSSLQRLGAQYGLIEVQRVASPTALTRHVFRLRFAASSGMAQLVEAYRRDPHVVAAEIFHGSPGASRRPHGPSWLFTRKA